MLCMFPVILLHTYSCVHDPCAVGSDGVSYMSDVDSIQVLVIRSTLNKNLQEIDQREAIYHK